MYMNSIRRCNIDPRSSAYGVMNNPEAENY